MTAGCSTRHFCRGASLSSFYEAIATRTISARQPPAPNPAAAKSTSNALDRLTGVVSSIQGQNNQRKGVSFTALFSKATYQLRNRHIANGGRIAKSTRSAGMSRAPVAPNDIAIKTRSEDLIMLTSRRAGSAVRSNPSLALVIQAGRWPSYGAVSKAGCAFDLD